MQVFHKKTPQWAIDLTKQVLADHHKPKRIELVWEVRTNRVSSSGLCHYKSHITIVAGTDLFEQKLLLLHELAHWMLPYGVHHRWRFWKRAFGLYRRYGLDLADCLFREGKSYPMAFHYFRRFQSLKVALTVTNKANPYEALSHDCADVRPIPQTQ